MENKNCKQCNKKFYKKPTCSKKAWETYIHCSQYCRKLSYPPKIQKKCLECSWLFKNEGKRTKDKIIRQSARYKKWRMSVFTRDNYTCQDCGVRNGCGKTIYLNADHIKPFALYPELRFDLNNGRTLCIDCHKKTDTWGRGAIFRKNNLAVA